MDTYKYINPDNLFEEDEDLDDYIFVSSSRTRNPPLSTITLSRTINIPHEGHETNLEQKRILEKQREIEQCTLKSSAQSIQNLRDTENIGIVTMKELVRQGETLNDTNRYIDEIDANLKFSQKNINGIQSVIQEVNADSKWTDNSENSGSISGRLRSLKQAEYAGACNHQDVNQMLDQNLIGISLGQEIKQQNDLIDVIQHEVDGTDIKIGGQITQINK